MDGVLADFNSAFIAKIREVTGVQLPPVSSTYPDVWNYPAASLTPQQLEQVEQRIAASDSFWKSLGNQDADASRAMGYLADRAEDGHEVYFITSRKPGKRVKQQTELWLHRKGFQFPTVIRTPDAMAKGLVASALGLDVFVDDAPDNANAVVTASPSTRTYLLSRPYNQADELVSGVMRISGLMKMLEREGLLVFSQPAAA